MSEQNICTCEPRCPREERPPLIGDAAPAFVAETTMGAIHFPQDYQGKWVILFSHPSDFTPVCTTELIAFSRLVSDCRRLNTELIGLSVDSLPSHIAWLYAIEEQVRFRGLKNIKIEFPLIADLSQKIARRYGMLHPASNNTQTVRAVFFIDPDGIIRTILYYPATTGRGFGEIMRILMGLQIADTFGVATPADWTIGDPVIKSAPQTLEMAKRADAANAGTTKAWFLTLDNLPREEIEQKLYHQKPSKPKKQR